MLSRMNSALVVALAAVALLIGTSGVAQAAAPNLVGYWSFNGNLNDASSNTNNGTANGTVTYTTGPFGQAISLAAASSAPYNYVSVPSSSSLTASWTGFTVSIWLQGQTASGGAPICFTADSSQPGVGSGAEGFDMETNWAMGGPSNYVWFSSEGINYQQPAWHNEVFRWTGTTMYDYQDGTQPHQVSSPTYKQIIASLNMPLCFGVDSRFAAGYSGYSANQYAGNIADAAVFGSALTNSESLSIYNVGTSALKYSMADMDKLFNLYGTGSGTVTTSDGKTWQYVASGLTGTAGTLVGSPGSYSIIFGDSGGTGGVEQTGTIPEPGTLALLAAGLAGLLCYAWRKRR